MEEAEPQEEWPKIRVEPYLEEGFRPYKRVKNGRAYITLKKGPYEKSLGPYTPQRWQKIMQLYREYRGTEGDQVLERLKGAVRGPGYLQELKEMFRRQISRSRELSELCFNIGLAALFAALCRTKLSIEDFKRVAFNEGNLKDALQKAAETVFYALENLDVNVIAKLKRERDEARVLATIFEGKYERLKKAIEPKIFLEKLIHTLVMVGNTDPNLIFPLVQKWLSLKVVESLSRFESSRSSEKSDSEN